MPAWEPSTGGADDVVWDLRLYIVDQTPSSRRAIERLQEICEGDLAGHYRLEVVDLLARPQLAERDQILAVPTLVRRLPPPIRKIIGDLSDKERVLVGLQLDAAADLDSNAHGDDGGG